MILSKILREFDERVVVLGSFYGEFREGLKSIPFNWVNTSRVYPRADWWCILDADEIYYEDPRQFLSKIPPNSDESVQTLLSLLV